MRELFTNPLFSDYLPALDYGQEQQLEKSLREDLTSEPVLWWHNVAKDRDELIDGHHRYRIAKRCGIDLQLHEKHFENEDAALLYIIRVQTTRRNVENRAYYLKQAVNLEIKLNNRSNREAVEAVATDMGVHKSTVYRALEDEPPENPVIVFNRTKAQLEQKISAEKTRAADQLKRRAETEGLTEDDALEQWSSIEGQIEERYADEFNQLESLGQVAQQAVEDNPGLKRAGQKRPTKKSTRDKAKRRNTFKKTLSLINKLRNEAFYFWEQNGCGDVELAPIQDALKTFERAITSAQSTD